MELAGQVYMVGNGEHLSQSRAAPAGLLPLPCFMVPWQPLPSSWLRHDMLLFPPQVGAAIWVSFAHHAIAWSICMTKEGCKAIVQRPQGVRACHSPCN